MNPHEIERQQKQKQLITELQRAQMNDQVKQVPASEDASITIPETETHLVHVVTTFRDWDPIARRQKDRVSKVATSPADYNHKVRSGFFSQFDEDEVIHQPEGWKLQTMVRKKGSRSITEVVFIQTESNLDASAPQLQYADSILAKDNAALRSQLDGGPVAPGLDVHTSSPKDEANAAEMDALKAELEALRAENAEKEKALEAADEKNAEAQALLIEKDKQIVELTPTAPAPKKAPASKKSGKK